MVQGRNQVRSHFQHKHGQGQHQRHGERPLQALRFGVARLRLAFSVVVLRGDGAGLVAHLDHGIHQGLGLGGIRVVGHQRALGGQVDLGLGHAGNMGQGLFHALHARRARHAFNGEFQLGG
ncbi:hypothetical protein D3C71_1762340 [compost metagenome]